MDNSETGSLVERILNTQLFAVLATRGEAGRPHLSIVTFLPADDLRSIVFVTPRNTRKYASLREDPATALFIDDRRETIEELMEITGIEAAGEARETTAEERAGYRSAFLERYPGLGGFYDDPENAVMRVTVNGYSVVDRFGRMRVVAPRD